MTFHPGYGPREMAPATVAIGRRDQFVALRFSDGIAMLVERRDVSPRTAPAWEPDF